MRRRARGLPEVEEVEALVLAVGVARRILEPEEQRGRSAELRGEGADERDRAAAADRHGLAVEAQAQRAPHGVERGPDRLRAPARRRALELRLDAHAARRVRF